MKRQLYTHMDKEHHILLHSACLHVSWVLQFLTLSYLKNCFLLHWKNFQDVNFRTSLAKDLEEKFSGPLSFVYAFNFILFIQFVFILPISMARTLSALRFTSLLSFIMSVYIVLAITMICLFDRGVNPDIGESFYKAFTNISINGNSFFNSLPLVMFSYMY